jgi:translation elongation factor EF-1beta
MADPNQVTPSEIEAAVADLKRQLQNAAAGGQSRIDCTQESIEQGLAKLVLTLIELLRRLLERQAIRRMEGGTLSDAQVEEMGAALMKLEQKIHELTNTFGLKPEDLNLDLGPIGKLLDDGK